MFEPDELRFKVVFVDYFGAIGARIKHPNVKYTFEEIKARKEEEHHMKDFVKSCEESKYNPIGKPVLGLLF